MKPKTYKFKIESLPRIFLFLTIFSIPFSVRTFFHDAASYASGMFFESTTIFLNVTEIFLWLTFVSFLIVSLKPISTSKFKTIFSKHSEQTKITDFFAQITHRKTLYFLLAFLLINIFTSFLSKDITLSLLFTFKIIEGILLAWLINQQILSKRELLLTLILVGLFQGSVAIRQFVLQHDLGLQFLSEPKLDVKTLGAAKMDIGEEKLLRGYGTFAHPNILGAFLVILFFFLDNVKLDKLKYLILIPLFFTFSRSAFLAVFVGLIVKALSTKNKFKKTIGALIVIGIFSLSFYAFVPERVVLDSAFYARFDFIKTSLQMFLAHPFGVGNANYLLNIQDFSDKILKPWEFQPVHNLYFLVLNENGLFGLIAFLGFLSSIFLTIWKTHRTVLPLFLAILILGLADHYFWDIDSGRWLFWMAIGLVFMKENKLKLKK